MNRIELVGRITKDLDLRCTQSGKQVVDFTLAVNRPLAKEGQQDVDFINVVSWDKQAENLAKYQGKGSLIAVSGTLRVEQYQNEKGENRYKTYVLAQEIEYLVKKEETKQTNNQEEFDSSFETEDVVLTDDELPF